MWYLVDWDEGIIEQANRKRDIVQDYYKCRRLSDGYYEVREPIENRFVGWLYRNKEDLIKDGWEWVFEDTKNKGEKIMKKFDNIDNEILLENFEMLIYQEQQTENIRTKKYKKLLSDIEDHRVELLKRLEGAKNNEQYK